MVINIQDDILKLHALGLLDSLLVDQTTSKHILWASDAYIERGQAYEKEWEITSALITGDNSDVIKTRARKSMEQQTERTRKHGEVFTPVWVCKKMNDHIDEVWFRRKTGFSKTNENGHVFFPKGKTWQQYADNRRMEITCGEAPYLVSRYNPETGEMVPIPQRIGILDRKLRVVSENTTTEEEWFTWAIRALQATYGYEFQGDSLLIGRVNVLMTFEEYLSDRWDRKPTAEEYRTIIRIITWNVWQMDGLKGLVPYAGEEDEQLSLFDTEPNGPSECRIYNWRQRYSFSYLSMKGDARMKFKFLVGNPPYQDEISEGGNKTYATPIYDKFMDAVYEISDRVELIHPARFLFNAGSTPKQWNRKMLSDPNFTVLFYEANSSSVFANTEIKGGVAITYHDKTKEFGAIGTFTPYNELNSIIKKVRPLMDNHTLSEIVVNSYSYHFTDSLHKDYPDVEGALSKGHAFDLKSNVLEKIPQVFSEEKPADGFEYVSIYGRVNGARVFRFIRSEYINNVVNLYKWKVFLPAASGNGGLGEEIASPIVMGPGIGSTETFCSIGSFDTEPEAQNALKYIKGKFFRALLSVLKVTQHITPEKFSYVPLQDFTSASDIDWTKSIPEIDQQLYAKYGLSEEEIAFIESHVKEME